ncbi:MAG: hypothetical protein JO033_25750 [Acidobacteriaceae bacterium]|nr:hypothetical protein [Acidobacteriaceae bacterium]MBV9501918.1 hypothetical protein [Acidobacteriaceae bacterium]
MQYASKFLTLAAVVVTSNVLVAGGFVLQIGNPSANPEAKARHAVLVIRGYACANPEKTTVKATAEGITNGKRETIPLKLISLSGQSTYAITRQWPAQGEWVLTLVASNPRFQWQPAEIVHVQGDSADFANTQTLSHAPTAGEIEAALHTTAVASR